MTRTFVTVGTTRFDVLIETMLSVEILDELARQGVTELVIQHGASQVTSPHHPTMSIVSFAYKPLLLEDLSSADLIISHAGAGTILESLKLGKELIVVVNEKLMDDHQSELADKLHSLGVLNATKAEKLWSLLQTRRQMKQHSQKGTFPFQGPGKLHQLMDHLLA